MSNPLPEPNILELELEEGDDFDPSPQSIPPRSVFSRYIMRCNPVWVVPLTLFLWVFVIFAFVDAVAEDAAPGVLAAFIASVVYFFVLSFYYVGKWCEYTYAARYPACYWVWHYIFCPIGCMSVNMQNAKEAVLDMEMGTEFQEVPLPEKRNKD